MSLFSPIKDKVHTKVHSSQYITTANEPDKADTKPADPVAPTKPEAK